VCEREGMSVCLVPLFCKDYLRAEDDDDDVSGRKKREEEEEEEEVHTGKNN